MPRTRRTLGYGVAPGASPVPSASIEAEDGAALLDVIRAELGVRSAARGCSDGSCGACRVLLGGELVASCERAWRDVPDGAVLETYETLEQDPDAARAVDAFAAERPTRCRMCVGALGVTAVAIAAIVRRGTPRDEAVERALARATCQCTGRGSWRRALAKT
jgi:aerobic-type carbon monoxide dehydrogenase small subunit (CoxS/CutS family)